MIIMVLVHRERAECMVCCSIERERGREYMLYGVILCMFACVFMLLCLANEYVYIHYIGYTWVCVHSFLATYPNAMAVPLIYMYLKCLQNAAGIFVVPFVTAPLEVHLGSTATAGMGPVGGGWGAGDARADFSKHDCMTACPDGKRSERFGTIGF